MERTTWSGAVLTARAVVVAFALGGELHAQAQPTPPNVTGKVVSMDGSPIADIEVRISGSRQVIRTDRNGRFAFIGVSEGAQELAVRGIGYLAAISQIRVPDHSTDLAVTLLPAPRSLDTVKVKEKLHVLSGVVVDERDRPVPGAAIELARGEPKNYTTDENGWFTITSPRESSLMFQVRKDGYFSRTLGVRLEEWRGIVVHLDALPSDWSDAKKADEGGTGNAAIQAWRDATLRFSMKGSRATIIPEEELAPFADLPLGEAIKRTKSGQPLTVDLQWAGNNICVLQNGKRPVGSSGLDLWRAGDVEMVELYPPGTEPSGTVRRYLQIAGCRTVAPPAGRSRGPFYAVLWMK